MKLANKYNIPEETITRMVKDGVISCKWPMHEEVYTMYLTLKSTGRTATQIYLEIGEAKKISEETVKKIVFRMGKI